MKIQKQLEAYIDYLLKQFENHKIKETEPTAEEIIALERIANEAIKNSNLALVRVIFGNQYLSKQISYDNIFDEMSAAQSLEILDIILQSSMNKSPEMQDQADFFAEFCPTFKIAVDNFFRKTQEQKSIDNDTKTDLTPSASENNENNNNVDPVEKIVQEIRDNLSSPKALREVLQKYLNDAFYQEELNLLMLCAKFNLFQAIELIINSMTKTQLNERIFSITHSNGLSAFEIAIENNNIESINILAAHPAIKVNAYDIAPLLPTIMQTASEDFITNFMQILANIYKEGKISNKSIIIHQLYILQKFDLFKQFIELDYSEINKALDGKTCLDLAQNNNDISSYISSKGGLKFEDLDKKLRSVFLDKNHTIFKSSKDVVNELNENSTNIKNTKEIIERYKHASFTQFRKNLLMICIENNLRLATKIILREVDPNLDYQDLLGNTASSLAKTKEIKALLTQKPITGTLKNPVKQEQKSANSNQPSETKIKLDFNKIGEAALQYLFENPEIAMLEDLDKMVQSLHNAESVKQAIFGNNNQNSVSPAKQEETTALDELKFIQICSIETEENPQVKMQKIFKFKYSTSKGTEYYARSVSPQHLHLFEEVEIDHPMYRLLISGRINGRNYLNTAEEVETALRTNLLTDDLVRQEISMRINQNYEDNKSDAIDLEKQENEDSSRTRKKQKINHIDDIDPLKTKNNKDDDDNNDSFGIQSQSMQPNNQLNNQPQNSSSDNSNEAKEEKICEYDYKLEFVTQEIFPSTIALIATSFIGNFYLTNAASNMQTFGEVAPYIIDTLSQHLI
jgi:hypothetical protein